MPTFEVTILNTNVSETLYWEIPPAIIARVSSVKHGSFNDTSTDDPVAVMIRWLIRLEPFDKMHATWKRYELVRPSRYSRRWTTTSNFA